MGEMRVFAGWDGWAAAEQELGRWLPPMVVDELGVAFAGAVEWHGGQVRPAGEAYWEHLLQVVDVLVRGLGVTDADLLRAGLLHDVVEDTDGTLEELAARFGERTARFVEAVTIGPEGRTAYLDKLAGAPTDVLLLKLSDRYSNVQRLHTHPRVVKQRSYYAETVERFVPMAVVDNRLEELYTAWATAYSYLEGPVDTVAVADKLAAAVHREQVDKGGEPYIRHVRSVAEIARRNGADEVQQMAALLHDSVEDTTCTFARLRDLGVPSEVLDLVDALTRRDDESHDDYLTRLTRTPRAVLVKRADVESNSDPRRRSRLDSETRKRLDRKYAHTLEVLDRGQGL